MSELTTASIESATSLSEIRALTDSLIDELPSDRLDAKRMIERALVIELRADELQAIAAIAEDGESAGEFRELPRAILAARALANQQLGAFSSGRVPLQALASTGQLLAIALDERGRIEDALRDFLGSVSGSSGAESQRLGEVCEVLLPERQPLVAALVLIPRLKALAAAAEAGDPRVMAPSLDESEVALLRSSASDGGLDELHCSRLRVDAVALRTIIEGDLQQWFRLAAEDGDEQVLCERREVFTRFTRDRLAHEVLTGHLQSGQDAALKANDRTTAQALRNARGRLFAEYLKLVPILRRGAAAVTDPVVDEAAPISSATERLASEAAEADRESERLASTRVTTEEIYLNALKQSKQSRSEAPVFSGADQLQRERRRLRGLTAVAMALFVVAAAVQVWLFTVSDTPSRIEIERRELTPHLPVASVNAIGTMLYARIDGWGDFSGDERVRRATEIGKAAAAQGFKTVYFVDTAGEALARWTAAGGLKLEEASTL